MTALNIRGDVAELSKAVVLVVAALFPIVNPFGSAAIFLDMTGPISPRLRDLLSRKISTFSFLLLIGSMLFGAKILTFFGVTLYAVQIGGGLVVAATGWSLLTQSGSGASSRSATESDILANAFYPYTLPVTVGPGSISVAITLGANLPPELHVHSFLAPLVLIASFIGVVLICVVLYFSYRYANSAERLIGATGTTALMRLLSFIMLCIGVQIVANGFQSYLAITQK
ncbi:MAG: MarC family protein [Bryobacteraceae bacterium]|jgi:multiple antibiotic resistance protein